MPASAASNPIEREIQHPLLAKLFEYWKALAQPGGIPLKSRFDPINLPAALWPRLHMIDVPQEGHVCRNRLLGTYIAEAVGSDFTGRPLTDDQIAGVSGSVTYHLLQQLLLSAEPQHYCGPSNFLGASGFAAHEQILLPLYDEDAHIVGAVGALDYPGFSPGMFEHRRD